MSCYVCLTEVVCDVKCANGQCGESICKECFQQYIEFSNRSSSIPYCPCGSTFKRTTVVRLCPKKELGKYDHIVLKEATLSVDNFDRHLTEKQNILVNFRVEKAMFMKTLPKGFVFVLNMSMKDKVKRLEQKMLKKVRTLSDSITTCKKLLCPGILDKNGQCRICETIFCVECELEKKNGDEHKCDQGDLDTVKLVKQIIECPNCKVKITRSYGCNFITCSICKTNFHYVTGQRTSVGTDHPQHLVIKNKTLSDMIPEPEFKDILDTLSEQEPKQFKLSRNDLTKEPSILGKLFVKQSESIKKSKAYFTTIRNIEKEYAKGTLTKDILRTIVIED